MAQTKDHRRGFKMIDNIFTTDRRYLCLTREERALLVYYYISPHNRAGIVAEHPAVTADGVGCPYDEVATLQAGLIKAGRIVVEGTHVLLLNWREWMAGRHHDDDGLVTVTKGMVQDVRLNRSALPDSIFTAYYNTCGYESSDAFYARLDEPDKRGSKKPKANPKSKIKAKDDADPDPDPDPEPADVADAHVSITPDVSDADVQPAPDPAPDPEPKKPIDRRERYRAMLDAETDAEHAKAQEDRDAAYDRYWSKLKEHEDVLVVSENEGIKAIEKAYIEIINPNWDRMKSKNLNMAHKPYAAFHAMWQWLLKVVIHDENEGCIGSEMIMPRQLPAAALICMQAAQETH